MGEGGKGLPLTSQRGQPHVLDPVHSHLPLWSPWGKQSPCSSWDAFARPPPGGRTAASAQGGTQLSSPTSLSGASRILLHSRGQGAAGGAVVGRLGWTFAKKPASLLGTGCLPPLLITSAHLPVYSTSIISVPSPSASSSSHLTYQVPDGTVGRAICTHDQKP